MAIVNEDVRIVKFLLDHGANVHERCLGGFFLPLDQKDKANIQIRKIFDKFKSKDSEETPSFDSELSQTNLQSNEFTTLDTNYDGLVSY